MVWHIWDLGSNIENQENRYQLNVFPKWDKPDHWFPRDLGLPILEDFEVLHDLGLKKRPAIRVRCLWTFSATFGQPFCQCPWQMWRRWSQLISRCHGTWFNEISKRSPKSPLWLTPAVSCRQISYHHIVSKKVACILVSVWKDRPLGKTPLGLASCWE
jgi:hypothetical protein